MKKAIIIGAILILAVLGFYILSEDNVVDTDSNTETVNLFYYNPDLDKDDQGNILCSSEGLVPVEREIEESENKIRDTIKMLIDGEITSEEESRGIETEFPLEGFSLVNSTLENGELELVFSDPNFSSSGGSCRINILSNQIIKTAEQFPEVEVIRISPEEIFQP